MREDEAVLIELQLTIQEAGVFVNSEIYEVELELDNDAITIMVDSKRKKIEDLIFLGKKVPFRNT